MSFSFSLNLNATPANLGNEQQSIFFPYFTCFKLYKCTSIVSIGEIFVEKLIFELFISGQFRSHRTALIQLKICAKQPRVISSCSPFLDVYLDFSRRNID